MAWEGIALLGTPHALSPPVYVVEYAPVVTTGEFTFAEDDLLGGGFDVVHFDGTPTSFDITLQLRLELTDNPLGGDADEVSVQLVFVPPDLDVQVVDFENVVGLGVHDLDWSTSYTPSASSGEFMVTLTYFGVFAEVLDAGDGHGGVWTIGAGGVVQRWNVGRVVWGGGGDPG